jgi:hypothetical protein
VLAGGIFASFKQSQMMNLQLLTGSYSKRQTNGQCTTVADNRLAALTRNDFFCLNLWSSALVDG